MALDSVRKVRILCHSGRRHEVLSEIESMGSVHVLDLGEPGREGPEGVPGFLRPAEIDTAELSERLSSLERAISFLQDRTGVEPPSVTELEESELVAEVENRELIADARRAWVLAVSMTKLEGARRELEQERDFLADWTGIPLPLERLGEGDSVTLAAGTLGGDAAEAAGLIEAETPLVHIERLGSDGPLERVVVSVHREVARDVLGRLGEVGFVRQDFGAREGLVSDLHSEVEREIALVDRRMSDLHARTLQLAEELDRLVVLRDAAGLLLERMGAAGMSLESRHVSMLDAWVRERDIPRLRERLEALGEVAVTEAPLSEGEIPPSPLTEPPAAQPYTMLTDMYGQPTRKDPDPTPIMAPFFAVFFGICIGDAGYGLALAAGSALGWAIVRRRHGNPTLFRLLFQGGLASILVGVFLGGWFGIDFQSLPGFLQAPAMLLNRLVPGYVPGGESEGFSVSKQFLYLTLALGLVQLTTGIVVNLFKRLRAGEGLPAVLDQSGWLLATAGLFPWLFNRYLMPGQLFPVDGPVDQALLYVLALGALLIFVMGGREAKGIGRFGLGAYAVYGIVNLLGDMLSYSRLFALALSSAIIAQVINEMAGMLMSELGVPVVGVVLAVLVVAGGHLFNLLMACLSGFIHTARLQFVEFFGKFYDGTGVPFRPLRYRPRYVHIRGRGE